MYNTFAATMLGMCERYTHTKEEAEEVLMNGFMKVFSNLEQYKSLGSFEGWMRKIFIREALNYNKKFKLKWVRLSLLEVDDWRKIATTARVSIY